ncbi:MAG: hypothetical protein D6677_00205 [Calditrichaeota bacterium]|nr:MAG: hypothetical protein D6677_00205 [Calditrichota bacterium]
MYESGEIILTILLVLLGIQIAVLLFMKRMMRSFFAVLRDLKHLRAARRSDTSGALIAPQSTCQNCQFRMAYLNTPFSDDHSFTYRCRLSGLLVSLDNSCDKFQWQSSKSDKH